MGKSFFTSRRRFIALLKVPIAMEGHGVHKSDIDIFLLHCITKVICSYVRY